MNFFNSNSISSTIEPLTLPLKVNFIFGNIAFISLFIAALLYWFDFFDTRRISKKLKNFCMIGANIALAFLLMQRWIESGHFPLSNLYESLIGLSWGFTSVHLMVVLNPLRFFSKITRFLNNTVRPNKSQIYKFLGFLNLEKTQKGTMLSTINNANVINKQQPCTTLNVEKTVTNNTTSYRSLQRKEQKNYFTSSRFLPELNLSSTPSLTLASHDKMLSLKQKSTLNVVSLPLPLGHGLCEAVPLVVVPKAKPMGLQVAMQSQRHGSEFDSFSKVNDKIGAITAPTALLTSVFATFFLPPEITQASALIPALKSNWLTMHVTVMVASYAFLLIGSLLSITYCVYRLVLKFSNKKKSFAVEVSYPSCVDVGNGVSLIQDMQKTSSGPCITSNAGQNIANKHNLNLATWLNTTSYRVLGLGFPLLTIGILSGAVWANEAWGSYWSWDPKETWALITWLVFAVYFHSRYTRSSDSFVPATIASVGFVVIWICYLGVNLLGTGLHSYGWFTN